ncbi:MAG: hypothetical protein ABH890_07380 [Bacillota bacterium]
MMKQIIDRYVFDVIRRLPDDSKEDVKKELLANIDDMLAENRSEDHIEKVLLELGEPRLLANRYRSKDRYLISPAYFDDYLRILKIVMIIFLSVSLVFGSIDLILNLSTQSPWEMIGEVFSKLIVNAFTSLLSAFAWVTLIFWGIEKAEEKTKIKVWKLSNLPELPKQNSAKINRTGAVFLLVIETIFAVIFISLLINYIDYLGIYENTTMVAPIFTKEIVAAFIPLLILSASLSIIVSAIKVFYAAWNVKLVCIYTLSKVFSVIVAIIFINYPNLFNILMFDKIGEYLSITTNEVADGFARGIRIFSIFLGLAVTVDLITTWLKTIKTTKSN